MPAKPKLTVTDHTRIMQAVIRNAQWVGFGAESTWAPQILIRAASLATDPEERELLNRAAAETAGFLAELATATASDADWQQVRPTVEKILAFQGNVPDLRAFIKNLASDAQGYFLIGLTTAEKILEDGGPTIYNLEYVAAERPIWPQDVFISQLRSALRDTGRQVADVGKSDVVGAIVGAFKGGVTGGQAGALKGAVAGAVAGSARGGPGTAY